MGKKIFFDIINKGHHWFYNFNILKSLAENNDVFYYTCSIDEQQKELLNVNNINLIKSNSNISKNKVKKHLCLFNNLFRVICKSKQKKVDDLTILYLDDCILEVLLLLPLIKLLGVKCYATLHWVPNTEWKIKAINMLLKSNVNIVVHTKYIKERFSEKFKDNITVIGYPMNDEKKKVIPSKDIQSDEKIKVLCFGGTWYYKGLDILLESIEGLEKDIKVIIAGNEGDFKKDYILEKLQGFESQIELGYVEDERMDELFSETDIVVLPYRKVFSGESGILTEAINYCKPVVVPNIIHFKEIIDEYKNGIVYECENRKSLNEALMITKERINELKANCNTAREKYSENHSIESFVSKYEKLYLNS